MMRPTCAPLVFLVFVAAGAAAEPSDWRTLMNRASRAYAEGVYLDCGKLYVEAVDIGAEGNQAPYNAACCFALAGETDRAFELLGAAIDRGWRDSRHLETDPDLEQLRGDDRWPKLQERVSANREAYLATVNAELLRMYEEDQADRSGQIDWSKVGPRDEQRRRRVGELLESGAVKSADDHYHAAMVLQHGHTPEDYKMAHELALQAVGLNADHDAARWLAAAAKDRYLQSIGQPQIYGTQFRKVEGRWTLEPIDETALTDEERARWGVPPLAEAKRRVTKMNARN